MNSTRTGSRLPRSLRLVAAVSAATLLVACGSSDKTDGGKSDSGTSSNSSSTQGQSGDKPSAPASDLMLAADAFPGVTLTPIPASDLQSSTSQVESIGQNITIDPPQCGDFNNASGMDFSEAAAAQGLTSDNSAGVAVMVNPSDKAKDIAGRITQPGCEHFTMNGDIGGQPLKSESSTEKLDMQAPDGVDGFVATKTDSKTDVMGQNMETGMLTLVGTVRDVTVQVNVSAVSGPVQDQQKQLAEDLFKAQVEKVKEAK